MESLVSRPLKSTDYNNGVVELLAQLTVIDKKGVTEERFVQWCKMLQNNPLHQIQVVLDQKSRVIGIATLLIEPKLIHNFGFVGHIEDVVVHNDHRNRGIGKFLIDSLSKYGKEAGCYKVILDCSESNVPFYEKCGFKKHGVEMSLYF